MPVAPHSYWRSMLFVPGDRPDRFGKALASGADAVCLDLEDGVGPANKQLARQQMRIFLESPNPLGAARAVRTNAVATDLGAADLADIGSLPLRPDAVLLPKVESTAACRTAAAALGDAMPLVALLESVAGLREAHAIAAAPNVTRLMFGSGDYSAEVGCSMVPAGLAYARGQVVQAAAAAKIEAMDGAWLTFDDVDGLAAECDLARAMGFTGKPALHPGQIETIHRAFTPDEEAIRRAQGVAEAYRAAGGGVAMFEGRMLDAPIVRHAERVLALAGRRAAAAPAQSTTQKDKT